VNVGPGLGFSRGSDPRLVDFVQVSQVWSTVDPALGLNEVDMRPAEDTLLESLRKGSVHPSLIEEPVAA
jgi:hypothetical protein